MQHKILIIFLLHLYLLWHTSNPMYKNTIFASEEDIEEYVWVRNQLRVTE